MKKSNFTEAQILAILKEGLQIYLSLKIIPKP